MKEIMQFRGKTIGSNMSKKELLEVIVYLAAEMNDYKKENFKYSQSIYMAKLNELKQTNLATTV